MNASPQERKAHIDALGAAMLIAISANLGFNQVLIKLVNAGMSPLFQAGLRSACAIVPIALYMLWRSKPIRFNDGTLIIGMVCGVIFAAEFALLFAALERTTVGRASVLFYTMPVWVGVAAHFLIPGETMTRLKALGLMLAVGGVIIALLDRSVGNDPASAANMFAGDMMALLAAIGWAAIALILRLSRMAKLSPEMQLLYQLIFSAPILIFLAWWSGDLFRTMTPMLWSAFAYQVIGVVAVGFTAWFWVLSVYPAGKMASYAFLAPLFGVFFGWLILSEARTINLVLALILVGAGIYLVNRR